jgi:hypothetical protein
MRTATISLEIDPVRTLGDETELEHGYRLG